MKSVVVSPLERDCCLIHLPDNGPVFQTLQRVALEDASDLVADAREDGSPDESNAAKNQQYPLCGAGWRAERLAMDASHDPARGSA